MKEREMEKFCMFNLIVCFSLAANGAITENNIVVDPVISHRYESRESYIEEWLNIPLPSVTLSPGDIYRVHINFKDGKYIKVVDAPYISIAAYLSTVGGWNSYPLSNNGQFILQIEDCQNVLNTVKEMQTSVSKILGTSEYFFGGGFYFQQSSSEIVNGSLFGNFTIEFIVPTMVEDSAFSTKTYNFNGVGIGTDMHTYDHNLLEIVPEPCTLLLLGLGTPLLIRRRSKT
jgi:hypothetical protein